MKNSSAITLIDFYGSRNQLIQENNPKELTIRNIGYGGIILVEDTLMPATTSELGEYGSSFLVVEAFAEKFQVRDVSGKILFESLEPPLYVEYVSGENRKPDFLSQVRLLQISPIAQIKPKSLLNPKINVRKKS